MPNSTGVRHLPAILQKGFRPFFLLAALGGLFSMLAWAGVYSGQLTITHELAPVNWHLHEMLFGYTAAVIAGFLLTAVANWTGRETLVGYPLAALAALWVAGRVAPLLPITPWLAMAIDLAFLPILAATLARCIIASRNQRNYFVIAVLVLLWVANIGIYLNADAFARHLALAMVWVLMTVIATRVIPFFSNSGISAYQGRRVVPLDHATIATSLVFALCCTTGGATLFGGVGLLAAMLITAQLFLWWDNRILATPLVLILFCGYCWLAIGFGLLGAAQIGWLQSPFQPGVHAIAVGAIGALTLGMMTRVSLGHTGRPLAAGRLAIVAFASINLAAICRVFLPVLLPGNFSLWVQISAVLWALAMLCWLIAHAPLLLRPRPDGKPG